MSDAANLVETISLRWDARVASAAVQQIAAQVWAARGSPGTDVWDLAERLRQALKAQLGRAGSPAEQMRVMEISCLFEQAIGNRREALSLAKNLRHLSERKGDALQQVRSAVLLGEEWYEASEIALAIDWSRRALQAAKPLVIKGQGGRPVKVLFAAEEVSLAWRMALQGGADESVDKLLADALKRYEADDPAGRGAVPAAWSQVRMLQGRWAEAVEHTRRCLQADTKVRDPATMARALWAGARAAGRLGDLATARPWIEEALARSRASTDVPTIICCLLSQASILFVAGDDAWQPTADEAVTLAHAWKMEILLRWATLERSWMRLAIGQADIDEMRAAAEAFAKAGAGPLEAEARYALYHALQAAGQDAQAEYDAAREQFERLKMEWHNAKLANRERLLRP